MVVKYRNKPIEVEVFRWLGSEMLDGITDINLYMFLNGVSAYVDDDDEDILVIDSIMGEMRASKGDYLIKNIEGEIFPVSSDNFYKYYEKVTDEIWYEPVPELPKEIEQEKLYNVIVADQLLVKEQGVFCFRPINYTLSGQIHRFTESEIKEYESRLMEFAREVE